MTLSFDTVWRRWWKNPEPLSEPRATAPDEPGPSVHAPWLATFDKAGIPHHLAYPSTTLGRILDQTADRFGNNEAMIYNHHRWTYRELLAAVNRMAGGLAYLGVRRGERVLLVLPNCPEMVIGLFGHPKARRDRGQRRAADGP